MFLVELASSEEGTAIYNLASNKEFFVKLVQLRLIVQWLRLVVLDEGFHRGCIESRF